MCVGRSASDESFFFRGRHRASTSAPVIVPWRAVIALMMSDGGKCKVSVSGSEIARRFNSPMLSRIVAQKAAEHAGQADLASVARLKASDPQLPPVGGVEDSPDRVVAYAEQETESVPFNEHGACGPVDGDLPRHQIVSCMIVEGGGDNRGEE
jgi:hypothetical protein